MARHDNLQWQFNLRRQITDQADFPAFADGIDGEVDGRRDADDLNGNISTTPPRDGAYLLDNLRIICPESMISAEFQRHVETRRIEINCDDRAAPLDAQRLHDEEADHSTTDDDSAVVDFAGNEIDRMERHRNRLGHRRLFETQTIRQPIEHRLRYRDKLRERTMLSIFGAGHSKYPAVVAEIEDPLL